jgi:hypothetical protein
MLASQPEAAKKYASERCWIYFFRRLLRAMLASQPEASIAARKILIFNNNRFDDAAV